MSTPSDRHDSLPDDVRALLRAESRRVDISDDARARLATRLAASVVAFGAPPVPPVPPVTSPPRMPSSPAPPPPVVPPLLAAPALGLGAAGTKMLAALALSATAIVGGHALLGRTSAPPPGAAPAMAQVATVAPIASVEPIAAAAVQSPESAPVAPGDAASRATRSRGSRPAPMSAPAAVPLAPPALAPLAAPPTVVDLDGLREEQAPLDEARRELDRGDALAALNATRAHATRFPQGALAEARDALRIRALVRLGRTDDARRELAIFRAKHPHSLLLGEGDDSSIIP
jgi:hypothetical protein